MALTISNGKINFKRVNGLDKYSEYECQVLAFTTIGDGPRSAVVVESTMEDGIFIPSVYCLKHFKGLSLIRNI